jgi:hypothetical protein
LHPLTPSHLLLLPTHTPIRALQRPAPVLLRNKMPNWNEALRCWSLHFHGRVKFASVKNFQLVRCDDPEERVVMQFGKCDDDCFVLDFDPRALTAVQAFAIALTTFGGKVML